MESAISVRGLAKRYRIGERSSGAYGTLRESLMQWSSAPVRRIRRLLGTDDADEAKSNVLWALKDVSFDVKRGESVGIVGRNGAGKSTLLKVLSRITAPSEGRIEIRGRLGSLLEVGTGFHPELTGRENIFLNGAIIGMSRREIAREFDRIVDFSEVGRFIDTPVKRYSSGMYVKLAFSVAAHLEPDILLIDEVLSVGDLAFQRKCMDYAKRLLAKNSTLLFVSHNMFTIKAMCDRAICLAQGQVVADGQTDQVTKSYDQQSHLDIAGWAQRTVGVDPTKCPIHISAMEVLDEQGMPCEMFDHGRRMRIRLRYRMKQRVTAPNFTVAFIRSDNVACCNFSTALDGFSTGDAVDEGVLELTTPPLKLVSDLYSIHVLVWDFDFQRLHCAQIGRSFQVRDPLLGTHFGVFHERGKWDWIDSQSPTAVPVMTGAAEAEGT